MRGRNRILLTGPSSDQPEDGPVVYPGNAFDSRLRGDLVPLGSSPTKSQKKTFRVGGPQSPFSISSSFILSFVFPPFFLNTKTNSFEIAHALASTCKGVLVFHSSEWFTDIDFRVISALNFKV